MMVVMMMRTMMNSRRYGCDQMLYNQLTMPENNKSPRQQGFDSYCCNWTRTVLRYFVTVWVLSWDVLWQSGYCEICFDKVLVFWDMLWQSGDCREMCCDSQGIVMRHAVTIWILPWDVLWQFWVLSGDMLWPSGIALRRVLSWEVLRQIEHCGETCCGSLSIVRHAVTV